MRMSPLCIAHNLPAFYLTSSLTTCWVAAAVVGGGSSWWYHPYYKDKEMGQDSRPTE